MFLQFLFLIFFCEFIVRKHIKVNDITFKKKYPRTNIESLLTYIILEIDIFRNLYHQNTKIIL